MSKPCATPDALSQACAPTLVIAPVNPPIFAACNAPCNAARRIAPALAWVTTSVVNLPTAARMACSVASRSAMAFIPPPWKNNSMS
ncbi:hypothetical protein [Nocardia sp. NPDC056100]|uniref:hypothetical protein n=1 Tax=Nocardia sp. NPDC056100 TaxID=3345712 RepID=UPI0035D77C50